MRHRKQAAKLGRNSSHRTALMANMLKSLVREGRIVTTVAKAKELKRHADRLVTLAKKDTLSSRRAAVARLRVRYNPLTSKEARAAKGGDKKAYNGDREVIGILFGNLGPRFATRQGGYTRLIKGNRRVGDNAPTCVLEYLSE